MNRIKSGLILLSGIVILQTGRSQNVGISISGATPRNCAMLDIVSSNTGVLIPNLALTATNAYAPATGTAVDGLLIYNTATASSGSTAVYPGYYYWDNTNLKWVAFAGKGGKNWALLGNAGISTPAAPATYGTSTIGAAENWLGTTDANDIVFGTNNIERMRVKQTTGYVGIGVAAPQTKLHISRGDIGIGRIDGGDDTPYARFGLSNGWEQYLANNAFYNSGTGQWNYVNTGGYGGLATMMYQVSGVLSFYTASNGANPVAWNQRMTILNNGNVGINNSSPTEKLDVAGNVRFSQALMPNNLPGSTGQVLVSQGANTAPVWQSINSVIKNYSVFATRTLINSTTWTAITGLSQTVNTTGPATLLIMTYGSLECISGINGGSGCEIQIYQNGATIANAYQTIDVDDAGTWTGTIGHWGFQTVVNIAAAGSYTFVVKAHKYANFDNFYAGGNTTAPVASQNQGALIIIQFDQ